MIAKVVILSSIILIFFIYEIYLREYFKVKKVYNSLRNFLDVRDALVLKVISEIKDKKMATKIVNLIDERKENFKTSYNNSILADAKLNSELRKIYQILDNIQKNEVVTTVFSRIINLEKDLKNIRNEYNQAVENYNNNLMKNKYVCLRIIKMKPLDTYKVRAK